VSRNASLVTLLLTVLCLSRQPLHASDSDPSWSPDGKKIVFMSDRDGDIEIYVANADGTDPRRLTYAPGRDAHPAFSPDGNNIAFQSPRGNRQPQIYVMNAYGSYQRRLTDLPGFSGVPDWSPDGKRIIFQSNLNPTLEPSHWQIFSMNADGTSLRQITHDDHNDQVPKWAPNGKRIIFYSDKSGNNKLYTMRPDGSHWQPVSKDAWNDQAASWSHDGRRILLSSDRGGGPDIYSLDLKTMHETQLTKNQPGQGIPFWSPDEKTIAFTFRRGDHSDVYVMDADGSNQRKVNSLNAPGSTGADSSEGLLIVANSDDNTVGLISLEHPEAATKIVTGRHPQDVVASPDGLLAYVAEMGTDEAPENTVAVIDLRAQRIVKRFVLAPASLPHLLALSRDGNTLWAACAPENAIVELDTRSGTIRRLWNTRQKGSYQMAVTPDEKKIYVANFDSGSVSVIRRSDASVQVIPLGGQPIGIDASPDGVEIWVSNYQSNSIAVIDTSTDLVVQTFPSGGDGPARVKFTPDGKQVWVTQSRSNALVIFDTAKRRLIRSVATGKFSKGLLILPDGEQGLVIARDEDRVVEVDTAGTILKRIVTGAAPEGLAWVGRSHFRSSDGSDKR
jgi:YVTN family beta-propeller protein